MTDGSPHLPYLTRILYIPNQTCQMIQAILGVLVPLLLKISGEEIFETFVIPHLIYTEMHQIM